MTVNLLIDYNLPLVFGYSEINNCLRFIEAVTGIATLPGFTRSSIETYLDNRPNLFKKQVRLSNQEKKYIISEQQVDRKKGDNIMYKLLDSLDPAVNYPIEVFKATNILRLLQNE